MLLGTSDVLTLPHFRYMYSLPLYCDFVIRSDDET